VHLGAVSVPNASVHIHQRSQSNASPSKIQMFELDLSPIPESDSAGTFSEPCLGGAEAYEVGVDVNVNVSGVGGRDVNPIHIQAQGQSTSTLSGESSGSSTSYGELLDGGVSVSCFSCRFVSFLVLVLSLLVALSMVALAKIAYISGASVVLHASYELSISMGLSMSDQSCEQIVLSDLKVEWVQSGFKLRSQLKFTL